MPGHKPFGVRITEGVAADIARLKVYDWEREQKIAFANGSLTGTSVVGEDGYARFPIASQPPRLAYSRLHQQVQYAASPLDFIISPAHASDVLDWRQCASTLETPATDPDDPLIADTEYFFQVVLDCIIAPQVEKAQVEYQNAQGIGRKSVLLVRKAAYEGVYSALKVQSRNAIHIANCLDAVVTGDNASAVGVGCDFISGLLAIGDIRDLLIQGYNYVFSREDYDSTVTVLASIGVMGTLSSPSGGGAVLNVAVTATKTFAKALRKLGPDGGRAVKIIVDYLDSHVVSAPDLARKMATLEKMSPFLQVGALAVLEQEILLLLAQSIKSTDDLLVWVDYLEGYFERLGDELIGHHQTPLPSWLVSQAHASSFPAAKFLAVLRRVIEPPLPNHQIPQSLKEALKSIKSMPKKTSADDLLDALTKNHPDTIRAFRNAYEMGGDAAVVNLRNHNGLNLGGLTVPDFLKQLGDFDLKTLADSSPQIRRGLEHVLGAFNYRGKQAFEPSQGASHQMMTIIRMSREGRRIQGLELRERIVTPNGKDIGARDYDIVVNDGVNDIFIETKAIQPKDIKKRLSESMSFKVAEGLNPDEAGQLFKDLIAMGNGKKIEWHFDPRAAGMESDITVHIRSLASGNKDNIALALGKKVDDLDFIDFMKEIDDGISDMIKIQDY